MKITRDIVQDLQLRLLQDYLEIKMEEAHGKEWVNFIIKYCRERTNAKDKGWESYKEIVDICDNKGSVMVTKRSFDITILHYFLRFDFAEDCCVNKCELRVFKNYIYNIKEDKNKLTSHISDLRDTDLIQGLVSMSMQHLKEFFSYIKNSPGWGSDASDNRKIFIIRYGNELFGIDTTISVTDGENQVPGYHLEIYDQQGIMISEFVTNEDPFVIRLSQGIYEIRTKTAPAGFEALNNFSVYVTEDNHDFAQIASKDIPNDELFETAYRRLARVNEVDGAIRDLDILEKKNHMESMLLMAFLYKTGLFGVKEDINRSNDLIFAASFQEDDSTWKDKARSLFDNKGYIRAISYYLGDAAKTGSADSYYAAGRISVDRAKNYEICLCCFEKAAEMNYKDSKKCALVITQLKDGFYNIKSKRIK